MAGRSNRLLALLLVGLTGCATYRAAPLPTVESLLQRRPARVQTSPKHPWLPSRSIDLGAPLSDLDAARLALVASPDLNATRARVGVAQAQLFSAGLVADPQLSLSLDRPDPAGLVDALAAGLSFDLASLFTRSYRVAGARSELEQARLDVAWSEWLALNQVRTLVRRVVALDRQVAVAEQAADAAREIYRLTERNMQSGDARLDDVTVYQVGYLDAQDRRLSLQRQRTAARLELNNLIGVPPDTVLALSGHPAPRALSGLDTDSLVLGAARDRLDIRALQAGYAARERGVRVATLGALPLPQLSLTRARDSSAIWSRGAGVGLGLPLWNRNRGEISVALATRTQLATEYVARVHGMRADVVAQVQDLHAIDVERRALARELPELEASAQVIAQATREGGVPLVTYETVRASLLARQLSLLALEQAQAEGEVALETAIGRFIWETP